MPQVKSLVVAKSQRKRHGKQKSRQNTLSLNETINTIPCIATLQAADCPFMLVVPDDVGVIIVAYYSALFCRSQAGAKKRWGSHMYVREYHQSPCPRY